VPTRELLAPSQRAPFTELPAELDDRTLGRHYTLSDADLGVIRRRRRASTQLGFAVQLDYARFPGRALGVGEDAHPQVVATLASQLGIDPGAFAAYRQGRDTTRREHLLELQRAFGYRSFSAPVYRELAGWLLPIALSTDVGPVLVGAVVDELRARQILAPALSTIERLAWETRRRAQRLIFVRLTAALTDAQRSQLDALLVVPAGGRITPLAALRQPPSRPTPATFLALAGQLETIRALGLNPDVARQVHQTRPAREGARYSPQFPQRFAPERRYATLVAFLLETGASLTDQALELHDRLIGQYHSQTQQTTPTSSNRVAAPSTRRSVCMPAWARRSSRRARRPAIRTGRSRRFCPGRRSSAASPRRSSSLAQWRLIRWPCSTPPSRGCGATRPRCWTASSSRAPAPANPCSMVWRYSRS